MSIKTGFQFVDLKGTAFTAGAAAVTVAGVFATIGNGNGKTTIITDYKLGGTVRPASPIRFYKSGDNYVGTIAVIYTDETTALAYDITVTPADAVTITIKTITSASGT